MSVPQISILTDDGDEIVVSPKLEVEFHNVLALMTGEPLIEEPKKED